ncbi:hypothetical protein DH2020_003137 [Rehmannia glutinosa]|uniref:Germin-like protein n=1 Tax=Rehmannia glutinosa TaxID=99300 RepID=A0ABR0XKR7_REHGL
MAAAGAFSGVLLMMGVVMLSSRVYADPDSLQDICVADLTSAVKVNGYPCKSNVTADDFFFSGIANPGDTNNSVGALVPGANVQKVPGLNTLGISLARELDVGFITTANVLIAKSIKKGDIFAFPKGLVHYQKNNGDSPAAVLSAFNSQLPGTQSIAATLFAAAPPVPDNVLAKAFQVGTEEVQQIKSKFAPNQNLRKDRSKPMKSAIPEIVHF